MDGYCGSVRANLGGTALQSLTGITGWAQINGWRGKTDTLNKMDKRVEHDLWYMRNWSLWLDLKIMLLTGARGFAGANAY